MTKTTYVVQEYWPKAGQWMDTYTNFIFNTASEAEEILADVAPYSRCPMRIVRRMTTVEDVILGEETATMTMLPPAPGKCPECATEHAPDHPHDNQSLYYQMRFANIHGRFPTWDDAMSHCKPEVQAVWREELRKRGVEAQP